MIDTVDRYAPGFKASVVGRQALSPLDLEEVFGLTGGDIFHGALSLDQLFWARPALGYADYRGRCRDSISAARAPIPAAASPARPATTRRVPSWRTGAAGAFRPADRRKVGAIFP